MKLKNVFSFFLFLSLGLVILYLVYYKQEQAFQEECISKGMTDCSLLDKVVEDIKSAKVFYLLISILFFIISNVFRALRWNLLTKPMGYELKFINSFGAVTIGYFTNLALPRIGELMRAGVISKYEKIPSEKAFGTIITERVIDVIIFFLVSMLAVSFAFGKVSNYLLENVQFDVQSLAMPIAFIALLCVAGYFIYTNRGRIIATRFGQKLEVFLKGLVEGLTSIKNLDHKGIFIAYSVGIWICYFLSTYVAFGALESTSSLPPQAALVSLFLGSIGMIIPSPGGMGTYQFMVSEALSLYGVSGSDGFSFANLNFLFISLIANITLGLLAYMILPLYNRNK